MHFDKKNTLLTNNEAQDKSIIPFWLKVLIVSVGILAIAMIAMYVRNFGATPSVKQETWGQFGDFLAEY